MANAPESHRFPWESEPFKKKDWDMLERYMKRLIKDLQKVYAEVAYTINTKQDKP